MAAVTICSVFGAREKNERQIRSPALCFHSFDFVTRITVLNIAQSFQWWSSLSLPWKSIKIYCVFFFLNYWYFMCILHRYILFWFFIFAVFPENATGFNEIKIICDLWRTFIWVPSWCRAAQRIHKTWSMYQRDL